MRINIYGLGKLGLPLACAYASRGHKVTGIDIKPKIESIKQHLMNPSKNTLSTCDPAIEYALQDHEENLTFSWLPRLGTQGSEISFIMVQTPSKVDGYFSNAHVLDACKPIAQTLRKASDHLVVLRSTVSPLSCEKVIIPALEEMSGKKCGEEFSFCYSPSFVALGTVFREFLNPTQLLIGEYDLRSGDRLAQFYRETLHNPIIQRSNLVNVEIAKIVVASFLTTKITLANIVGELATKVFGADAHDIMEIVGNDSRIGKLFARPGFGYGGPCFPRDDDALIAFCQNHGVQHLIQQAVSTTNEHQLDRMMGEIHNKIGDSGIVCVLGMAYKPETNVIDDSMAIELIKRLLNRGYLVNAYDPLAYEPAREELHYYLTNTNYNLSLYTDLELCFAHSQVIVICIPCREFKSSRTIRETEIPIIDPWRCL